MKLSERLEDAASVACNPLDVALYREASALAKRYEDAPVIGLYGQRVRILLDTEGCDGRD